MRWLLHGSLSPAVAAALQTRGDSAVAAESIGISAEAPAGEVLDAASKLQLDVMTDSAALSDSPFTDRDRARFGRVIVYLQLEGADIEQDDAVERLFKRYKRLTTGRLYTVTASRVKIRQLPTS